MSATEPTRAAEPLDTGSSRATAQREKELREERAGPWPGLLRVVWMAPLWAIPFAVFFGTIFGSSRRDYIGAYIGSVIFAGTINLCIWFTRWFLYYRIFPRDDKPRVLASSLLFGGMAMFGSFLAAVIINFTFQRGFLGSPRQIVIIGMFALLFVGLFLGVMLARRFYRDSLDKARGEQELELARRIQRGFLPSEFPALPRLELHAVNVSSLEVSGDFYDVVDDGAGNYLLAIADVAGKGVGAALLSSMLQASLRTQAGATTPVAAVLRIINTLVYRSSGMNQFATFFLARIAGPSLRLSFSNAGHNYPMLFRGPGQPITLECGGTVVGILEDAAFEEESIDLRAGDRLVLYTDGITEAQNARGDLFGEERLVAAVHAMPAERTAREVTEGILRAVRGFLDGTEPGDDMTVMVLRVLGDGVPAADRPALTDRSSVPDDHSSTRA